MEEAAARQVVGMVAALPGSVVAVTRPDRHPRLR